MMYWSPCCSIIFFSFSFRAIFRKWGLIPGEVQEYRVQTSQTNSLQTHSILHTYCCMIQDNCTFVHSGTTYLTPSAVFISIYVQNIHLCHVISALSYLYYSLGFKQIASKTYPVQSCSRPGWHCWQFPKYHKNWPAFWRALSVFWDVCLNQSAGLLRSSENRLLRSG